MGSHSSRPVEHRPVVLNTAALVHPHRVALFPPSTPRACALSRRLGGFSACSHPPWGTGGHSPVSSGGPLATDLELSWGEKGREWLTQRQARVLTLIAGVSA